MSPPTVGSLFSGIGGLDLGLERAGMRVIWQSEIDPYCSRVLAKHWPTVPNLGDIKQVDWSTVERPDVICGGYPCQPFSLAGVRRGSADERHLWPYMLDAVRALRPRVALLENVPGHLSLGFGRVLGDLAESGYDTEWDCIPAAAVGAPHIRWRIFVVATRQRNGVAGRPSRTFFSDTPSVDAKQSARGSDDDETPADNIGERGVLADADRAGRGEQRWASATKPQHAPFERRSQDVAHTDSESEPSGPVDAFARPGELVPDAGGEQLRDESVTFGRRSGKAVARDDGTQGTVADTDGEPLGRPAIPRRQCNQWSSQSDVGRSLDGVSAWLDGTWEDGLSRTADGVPNRVDRLRALGNAVVPQVAQFVGERIMAAFVAGGG